MKRSLRELFLLMALMTTGCMHPSRNDGAVRYYPPGPELEKAEPAEHASPPRMDR